MLNAAEFFARLEHFAAQVKMVAPLMHIFKILRVGNRNALILMNVGTQDTNNLLFRNKL